LIPDDSAEEGMLLDRRRSIMSSTIFAQPVVGVTEEAAFVSIEPVDAKNGSSPSDHVLRVTAQY
jgi:hypothetical protein